MKCSQCSFENAAEARFCEQCGQPLELSCPNCGQTVSPQARFCRRCGHALAERLSQLQQAAPASLQQRMISAGSQMEGERKLVTILFTDIVGSTTLAEQMDPEEWREVVVGAHQRVSDAVYRYEGTIAQLLGDGVLAFFGAPLAHEDDPERAVRAALGIQAAVGEYARELQQTRGLSGFRMRIGLNTGLVVVGQVGSDTHLEYLPVGDTVNTAARMQAEAEPGSVLISSTTARWVRHAFELEPRGALELKGRAEPVPAFRVARPREVRVSARGIEGLESPLVGREREFTALQQALQALRQGRGQIVSVMGEAGLGKSRLVAELSKADAALSDGLRWLEGRCLSFTSGVPYAPFADLLQAYFGLRQDDSDAERWARIRDRLSELLPDEDLQTAVYLATLLGVELEGESLELLRFLEPPQLRERLFEATHTFLRALAQRRPTVVVLEDLHWADPTSLDLLVELLSLTERQPLLLLAICRPQRQEPSWRFHEAAQRDFPHRYLALELRALDEDQSRTLVANLLHVEDLPLKVRNLILGKAEGNPFFVEEVIRSLLDAGLVVRRNAHWVATREIERIALPDTLAGVIAARLDQLAEEAKRLAQTASVIGREFDYGVLRAIYERPQAMDPPLLELQRRELIREKARLPQPNYAFKHALTQETAYASLLMTRRRELHRRVAERLEELEPERVNEIARHLLEALEEQRAIPYLVEAGDRAARAYAMAEAQEVYRQAIRLLERHADAGLARRAHEGLGKVQTLAGDLGGAAQTYRGMLSLAEGFEEVPMQVSAHNKLAKVVLYMGQFEESDRHLVSAERLAEQYEDRPGLAETCFVRCAIGTLSAQFDQAEHYLGRSVQIGHDLRLGELEAMSLAHLAATMVYMTRFDEAWERAQEGLVVSRASGDRAHEAEILSFAVPYVHLTRQEIDQARDSAAEALGIAERIGSVVAEMMASYVQGEIDRLQGRCAQAVRNLQRARQAAGWSGIIFYEVAMLGSLAGAYDELEPAGSGEAVRLVQEVTRILEMPGAIAGGGVAWLEMGHCFLRIGDRDRARELFEQGLEVRTPWVHLTRPRYLSGLAAVHLEEGGAERALELVTEARAYLRERRMGHLVPEVALVEGRARRALGETGAARECLERALAAARSMGMRPFRWQACAALAELVEELGRAEEARRPREEAWAVAQEIASEMGDPERSEGYLAYVRRRLAQPA